MLNVSCCPRKWSEQKIIKKYTETQNEATKHIGNTESEFFLRALALRRVSAMADDQESKTERMSTNTEQAEAKRWRIFRLLSRAHTFNKSMKMLKMRWTHRMRCQLCPTAFEYKTESTEATAKGIMPTTTKSIQTKRMSFCVTISLLSPQKDLFCRWMAWMPCALHTAGSPFYPIPHIRHTQNLYVYANYHFVYAP